MGRRFLDLLERHGYDFFTGVPCSLFEGVTRVLDADPRYGYVSAVREDSATVFDLALVDAILPLAEGLPERLRAGADLADIGCGAGHAINLLARAFPNSRFTGYDFSEESIGLARAEADAWDDSMPCRIQFGDTAD